MRRVESSEKGEEVQGREGTSALARRFSEKKLQERRRDDEGLAQRSRRKGVREGGGGEEEREGSGDG